MTRTNLAACLDTYRDRRMRWGYATIDDMAREIGISSSALQRYMSGNAISGKNLEAVLRWLLQENQ